MPAIHRLAADGHAGRDDVVVGVIGGSGFRELDVLAAGLTSEARSLPEEDPIGFLASLALA